MSQQFFVKEYGTLYIKGEKHNEGDVAVNLPTFHNLWNSILENKTRDLDSVMSIHTRAGRQFIRIGKYVGTIQTKDGATIEILPKIYRTDGAEENDIKECKRIFLRMLRHLPGITSKSFQDASLETLLNFPILECYIIGYLNEVDSIFRDGLKSNYKRETHRTPYLKGQLMIEKQIAQNITDMSRFICRSEIYTLDIPQNRLIVSCLHKIQQVSISSENKIRAANLRAAFDGVSCSANVEADLITAKNANRLYNSYSTIIEWSEQLLKNKGFTTFSGQYINQSLLFPAEQLFEGFIAHLFKKYAKDFIVKEQHRQYFLVDNHSGRTMFRLRPDLYLEKSDNKQDEPFIIDTKWKILDSVKINHNYLMDIKDMYQLYSYGKKYGYKLNTIPKLILIYPYSNSFTKPLDLFYYEKNDAQTGIQLYVAPFDLSEPSTYHDQINKILRLGII